LAASDGVAEAPRELRVVCGPTAAGKSALAMMLAEQFGAAILSADSRQVYRRFDVGTAKPSDAERARVPHFGLDVAEPTERYSAARWSEAVDGWLAVCDSRGLTPLVVGGTGFYLRALFEPLFAEPVMDPEARRALDVELSALTLDELRDRCRALDPPRAELGRTQLLRAIEVATLGGRPISELHAAAARSARYRPRYLLVDPGDSLGTRIERRAEAMLGGAWPDEVRALDGDVPDDAPAWNATGYLAVRDMVRGEITERAARERVVIGTRQYA
jgi:tRNA dimethylallyltransferase